MTKENTVAIDDASKAAADALEQSGKALGGSVATDEDPLFAAMMAEADADDADEITEIFGDE